MCPQGGAQSRHRASFVASMRWAQNNNGKVDDRLWQDKGKWHDAARFWHDLAAALKDHPAIAAYNLINEPAPEKKGGL
jgi:hypothetical protein